MEPILDSFLFSPIASAEGVDARRRKLFEKLLGPRLADALFHRPIKVLTRRYLRHIADARDGDLVTIQVTPTNHSSPKRPGGPGRITCSDGHDSLTLVFFGGSFGYQCKNLPLNQLRTITGKVSVKKDGVEIVHPEVTVKPPYIAPGPEVKEPVYPLTHGITNKCVLWVMKAALTRLESPAEWISPNIIKEKQWPDWKTAITHVHRPKSDDDLESSTPWHSRLCFDEMLAHQVALIMVRQQERSNLPGLSMRGTSELEKRLTQAIPFQLTQNQEEVLADIYKDMAAPYPMARLLQGDVGSGKTIVALFAMVRAIESGYQAAILAPTDILARQHAETLLPLASCLGIKAEILTGRDKGKVHQNILDRLAAHEIDLLIGTHAIIQEAVKFHKLGLAVVDEQHRFGVEQRMALAEKGNAPDILAMTATPIPRTLMLANHGDMDVSVLREKPAGRQPIKTTVLSLTKLDEVVAGIERALQGGTKIFWVCPLVEESEVLDLAAAEDRAIDLKNHFGDKVGLVHGRMKAADKDAVMESFVSGDVDLLVSTTVIEVGVNVPAATIMVIEHAERFGLAQLHQLRGRIGRGDKPATCVLLYHHLSEIASRRLNVMRDTNDGFLIAEEDLKLRGGGDILGTRQSGTPGFRLADFLENPDHTQALLELANEEARRICEKGIEAPLHFLLKLFDKDESIRYSRS